MTSLTLQFSRSVASDSLWPHGLQHARLLCPSRTPRACSNSCPLSCWSHLTISSSLVPFSSCLQSFPASGSFPMNQLFALGDQSIGASISASVLPINIQDWLPLGLTYLISLQSKGLSTVFSNTTVQKTSILWHSDFFMVQLSYLYTTTGKTTALTIWTSVSKVTSLLLTLTFSLNYHLKLYLHIVTLEVRVSTHEFQEDPIQSSADPTKNSTPTIIKEIALLAYMSFGILIPIKTVLALCTRVC